MVGKGVSFTYNEKRYYIGNQKMLPIPLDEKSLNDIREFEEKGMTTLIMSDEFCVLGIFALADTLRKETKQLIFDLRKMGIKKMIMLTGDQPKVAATIAQELQLDGYEASLLPQDKANYIQAYQQSNPTIFVGDGINDALAMSYASVSIAVGGLGKDLAMETADVVLMSDQLGKLKETLLIAHQVKKTMIQNIGLALLVVLFLILGVLFKQVSMSLGMLVHELSVLIVLLNAIRLLKYRPEERYEKTKKHQ